MIESSYSGVACRSKNCFYWDSGNMDRITKQQKNEVLRYLQKWTISTFPWMMTTSYLSLVRVQTWNNASYNVSLFPSHIFVDHGPLLLYYFFLRWYYFAKQGMRQRSPRRRKKKVKRPSKKRKLKTKRYNCYIWDPPGLPM